MWGWREKTDYLGNLKLLIIKVVIKSRLAPDASQRECLQWMGFPHTHVAGLCGFQSAEKLEGRSEARRQ